MSSGVIDALDYFSNALVRFEQALEEDLSNPLAVDGSIQRFEFTFELACKLEVTH